MKIEGTMFDAPTEDGWVEHIRSLKTDVETAKKIGDTVSDEQLKNSLVSAVQRNIPSEPFGVLFSGGVDSSLIAMLCKQSNAFFTCYTVGFKTDDMDIPPDIEHARRAAAALGVDLVSKVFTLDDVERLLKQAIKILPIPKIKDDNYIEYVVKISVAAVLIGASALAKERIFLSGIGAEELFAGYHRHGKAAEGGGEWRDIQLKDIEGEGWDGLERIYDLVIRRDSLVADSLGIHISAPFLDDGLIVSAMQIPPERKIDKDNKKIILREIAENLGLPHEFAWRKKQGAQYGSRFDRALIKLAKRNAFELKKRYIDQLIEQVHGKSGSVKVV